MVLTHDAVVADVAVEPIVCVSAQASLVEVARVFEQIATGIVIVDSEELSIVTERDVLVAFAEGCAPDTPVAEIAHDGFLAVQPSTPLTTALERMLVARVHALAVVDGERQRIGLLTLRTALSLLVTPLPWVGALRLALHIEEGLP